MNKFLLPILISTVLISGCKNPFEAKDKGIDQLNNIEQQLNNVNKRLSTIETMYNNSTVSNNKYSSSNYQMM